MHFIFLFHNKKLHITHIKNKMLNKLYILLLKRKNSRNLLRFYAI